MEGVPKYIPNRLRKYRKEAGYTQKDVAFLLGLRGYGRISEWENGIKQPNVENLLKLAIIYRALTEQLYVDVRRKFIPALVEREKVLQSKKQNIHDQGG